MAVNPFCNLFIQRKESSKVTDYTQDSEVIIEYGRSTPSVPPLAWSPNWSLSGSINRCIPLPPTPSAQGTGHRILSAVTPLGQLKPTLVVPFRAASSNSQTNSAKRKRTRRGSAR